MEDFYFYTGIFAFAYSLVAGLQYYTYSGKNFLSAEDAKKKISNKEINTVIDVRTLAEYDFGHYPDALHLPVSEISEDTTKMLNKEDTYLVYCNTGQRARYASELLNNLGFENVYYIPNDYTTILD
tara:strand:- start:726 stop:1103 length:378 start_codon:yes stop_codon:yes gene_type:complete